MKRLTSYLCAAAMAVSTAGFGVASTNAQPLPAPTTIQSAAPDTNLIQVRRHGDRAEFRWRGDRPYYRGHRGYRHPRPGWRQRDGWWFPPAAFAAGAILGGLFAQAPRAAPPPRRGLSQAHVQWCFDRYRSYRVSDNTFQPYQGPRRQCRSPYG
jgi:hypothetical protein